MSKVKKVLAIILSMAMILGMSLTTFAAPDDSGTTGQASVTVEGLTPNDETEVKIYEVVTWDAATNAWVVADWVKTLEEQNSETYVSFPSDQSGGDATIEYVKLAEAIENAAEQYKPDPKDSYVLLQNEDSHTFNGLNLGAYLVTASGDTTTYSAMGGRTYKYDEATNYVIGALEATVYAKGSNYPLDKVFSDGYTNKVAGLGDTVQYDITTIFPSFGVNTTDKEFWITDTPQGLKITGIAVYVGDMATPINSNNYTISPSLTNIDEDTPVTVTFTENYIGETNEHAGAAVKVVVTATVTGTTYKNTATSSNNSSELPVEVDGDTGTITLTKTDGDHTLPGAEFEVKLNNNKQSFVMISDGVYRLATSEDLTTTSTVVVGSGADNEGVLVLDGLKEGIYTITETKAPEGFALLGQDIIKEIKFVENATGSEEDQAINIFFEVVNTKLSSLPETGGIGTTIFTIGGCAIMIAAAGLYFASRRKQENK